MKNIRPHPHLPFIQIGRFVDYAAVADAKENHESRNESTHDSTHDNDWCFTIDGMPGFAIHQSERDANLGAERTLFHEQNEIAQCKLDRAIQENDITLALAIAERRGYWLGVADQRQKAAKIVNDAISLLSPMIRN